MTIPKKNMTGEIDKDSWLKFNRYYFIRTDDRLTNQIFKILKISRKVSAKWFSQKVFEMVD